MNNVVRKRMIQEYYAKRWRDYDRQKSRTWKASQGFSKEVIDETLSVLGALENKLVLELDVGSGRNALPPMKEVELQFVGLDLSKEMLALANSKMTVFKRGFNLILADAESLPFVNDAFDAVVCMSTMHYFTSQDKMLKRFSTVLKKDGTFVYGDLTIHESDDEEFLEKLDRTLSKVNARYCKPTEMQRLLKNRGFAISRTRTVAYEKSYSSLVEDKGKYLHVTSEKLCRFIRNSPSEAKTQHELTSTRMTLYYTIVTAQKAN